jgi:hypothetical protein
MRRQEFIVEYAITYPSGKKWRDSKSVYAITKEGAADLVRWLFSSRTISITSVNPSGTFVGADMAPTRTVLGDY